MSRLTRNDIIRSLLTAQPIEWTDAKNKKQHIRLDKPEQRRLFLFLVRSEFRGLRDFPNDFIEGLAKAYAASSDPATDLKQDSAENHQKSVWRLQSIESEGFGGINILGGPKFVFNFDGESLMAEGPNSAGKSSLVAAIVWACTGERPRDHGEVSPLDLSPVYDMEGAVIGSWPSIASYPDNKKDLSVKPFVRVRLNFIDDHGNVGAVERTLSNGQVDFQKIGGFSASGILVEAGITMPVRLANMKFEKGQTRLTDALKRLTRLDDLAAIGAMCGELCHGAREYLSIHSRDIKASERIFESYLQAAGRALTTLNIDLPTFVPEQTQEKDNAFRKFLEELKRKASLLTESVKNDLLDTIDFGMQQNQQKAIAALGAADTILERGLESLEYWRALSSLATFCDVSKVRQAILDAYKAADEARRLLEQSVNDPRLQLKAIAAQWHDVHIGTEVDDCPLCQSPLKSKPVLAVELEALRKSGSIAARSFDDNIKMILASLNDSMPDVLKSESRRRYEDDPVALLRGEFKKAFLSIQNFSNYFVNVESKLDDAIIASPNAAVVQNPLIEDHPVLQPIYDAISSIENGLAVAEWFENNQNTWLDWWQSLAEKSAPSENFAVYIKRISDALISASPYSTAAESLNLAYKEGEKIAKMMVEVEARKKIAIELAPLKELVAVTEATATGTIDRLSGSMQNILQRIMIEENMKFQTAGYTKREGLSVKGSLSRELAIDATLVANTSWLKIVLWAFIFALRDEEVEVRGIDDLPVFLFDDPQATLDRSHRTRWAAHVASYQKGSSKAQVIIASHDQDFIDLISTGHISGRFALIERAIDVIGHLSVFDGSSLDRKWNEVLTANTQSKAQDYIKDVRIYVEGMLRLMLRGQVSQGAWKRGLLLGECKDPIASLHSKNMAPWDQKVFLEIVSLLDDAKHPAIAYMQAAHHPSDSALGVAEAQDVEEYWRKKLRPKLEKAFRLIREHHVLHGGLAALHGPNTALKFPNGNKALVQMVQLEIVGKVAALTNGRMADGQFSLTQSASAKRITLAQHAAFRLLADTLEPVAQTGDILLVKEGTEPTPKSLTVAADDQKFYARRYEIAQNQSDVVVLTAQALNPSRIRPPFICRASTISAEKIVGVVFNDGIIPPIDGDNEIAECDAISLNSISAKVSCLWEVDGSSAEPYALHGQYLISGQSINIGGVLHSLQKRLVIAEDSNGSFFFKRLQMPDAQHVVLESLDNSGAHGPILLGLSASDKVTLTRVWPVYGILFELP